MGWSLIWYRMLRWHLWLRWLLWHQKEITLVFHQLLSQRNKYVEVNGIQSSKKLLWRECHRDPFWAPFYSWCMLNDITWASEYFSFILYADDTTLFSTMPYSLPALPNEHNVLINGELFKVNDPHVSIRSSLYANNTKYMIFRSSKRHNLLSLNLILKNFWIFSSKIHTHSLHGFSSAVKHLFE